MLQEARAHIHDRGMVLTKSWDGFMCCCTLLWSGPLEICSESQWMTKNQDGTPHRSCIKFNL